MESKKNKYTLLIITSILLIGISIGAYFYIFEPTPEPQQALIQKDANTDVKTVGSISKSTVILIFCVGLAGLLGIRRKKIE